jgi:hypothetical protein
MARKMMATTVAMAICSVLFPTCAAAVDGPAPRYLVLGTWYGSCVHGSCVHGAEKSVSGMLLHDGACTLCSRLHSIDRACSRIQCSMLCCAPQVPQLRAWCEQKSVHKQLLHDGACTLCSRLHSIDRACSRIQCSMLCCVPQVWTGDARVRVSRRCCWVQRRQVS